MEFTDAWRRLQAAQKGKRGVSLYSRWINRPLGRLFAAAAASWGIGPNAVTAVSALTTVAGLAIVAAVPVSPGSGVLAAVLLVLGFALDAADGQVARLSGIASRAGEWLDHVIDAGKMVAVHAAVLIGLYRAGERSGLVLLAPLSFALVSVVLFAGLTLHALLSPSGGSTGKPSSVRAVLLLSADFGILAVSFVLWGFPHAFLAVYASLLLATSVITTMLCVKWFRSLAASERS